MYFLRANVNGLDDREWTRDFSVSPQFLKFQRVSSCAINSIKIVTALRYDYDTDCILAMQFFLLLIVTVEFGKSAKVRITER